MDPKEIELRQALKAKLEEARAALAAGDMEKAEAAKNAAAEARKALDLYLEVREIDNAVPSPSPAPAVIIHDDDGLPSVGATREDKRNNREHRDAFITMLRGEHRLTSQQRSILEEHRAQMNSTSGEDGGYLIPPDIQVMINELKRQYKPLSDLVTTIPVVTNSGSRVLEKYQDITGFVQIAAEDTKLADLDNPKVKQISYSIKDYGGIITLTNNLLADSPENIMSFISKWIARKEVITDNSLILAILTAQTPKAIGGLDDLKEVINVSLDPMIADGAVIVTNQDGYNYLDTQKDGMGRYLLQPDPTQPGRKLFDNKPVIVFANRLIPTTGGKAPIIIGDLKESVVIFDRQQMSMLSTNIGGGAFENNTTKTRVIDREDVKAWDDGAWVYGQITIS
jgi:HK97 family phage major capsid protein